MFGKREKSNGTWLKLHSAYGHEIYDTFGAKSHQQLRWSITIDDHHRQHLIILELHLLQGPRGKCLHMAAKPTGGHGRSPSLLLSLSSLRWVLHQNICKCSAQGSERDRGRIGGGTHAVCKLLDGCRLTNATANNDAVGGAFLSAFL